MNVEARIAADSPNLIAKMEYHKGALTDWGKVTYRNGESRVVSIEELNRLEREEAPRGVVWTFAE